MNTHICSACNKPIRSGSNFCTNCGIKQVEDESLGPCLMILTKDQNSVLFPLKNGKSTIGRHIKNSIILQDEHVSTYHAVIIVENGHTWIEDSKSRNGVFVNGKKISGRSALKDGSLIKIGSTILKYSPNHEYVEEKI